MKHFSKVILLLFTSQLFYVTVAQKREWKTYLPPNHAFSVELPVSLKRVVSFEGEHGASFKASQSMEWAICYSGIESAPEDSRFGIVTIRKTKSFFSQPRDKLLWYLSAVLIGDDDNAESKSEKDLYINGSKGKEYFHVRESHPFSNGSTSSIHTRGRIFDAGDEIYVIVYRGRDADDLISSDAQRFLDSFLISKNRKNRKS